MIDEIQQRFGFNVKPRPYLRTGGGRKQESLYYGGAVVPGT